MKNYDILLIYFFDIYFILTIINILVHQYYNLIRLSKFQIRIFRLRVNLILFLVIFFLVKIIIYFINEYLLYILILIEQLIFITNFKLNKYKITRRNFTLLIFSLIIYTIFICIMYYIGFNYLISEKIVGLISVFLSYFVLLPVEKIIQKYYIKKARNKIVKNKYQVIGITGSYGKTTLKNMLTSILNKKYQISKANHNYNTVLGLAKFINNEVDENDDILIVELGIDKVNSMHKFKQLFKLDIALISEIGLMHLATFKTLENIVIEKLKISELLKENGVLFINKKIEDNYKEYIKQDYKVFSENNIKIVNKLPYHIIYDNNEIKTSLLVDFHLAYLDACLQIAKQLNLDKYQIKMGLKHINLPDRRLQLKIINNYKIIDDSYNSNIDGIKTALKLISNFKEEKCVIFGGLLERGKNSFQDNFNIAKNFKNIDQIYFVNDDLNHPFLKGLEKEGLIDKVIVKNNVKEVFKLLNYNQEKRVILYLCCGEKISLN